VLNAASENHCILDPAAQVPVNIAELPAQILGAFIPVGAEGVGVTVTAVEADGPLQEVFVLFIQIAK
jgi:hypothetical protein